MIAKLLVQTYFLVHGRLGLPGAGWLIRRCCPWVRGLWDFPLAVPGVGTARLDFRDGAAFGMLNVLLRDYGQNAYLFRCIDLLVEPGQVVWDIGANVGYFLLYYITPPRQPGIVHAFEPNPAALKTVQSLFVGHPRVRVHPVGLGRADQVLEMNVVPGDTAIGSLTRDLPNAKRIQIQVRNGDAYRRAHALELPDFIKMDVEGFEVEAFRGLVETIALKRPVILFEHGLLDDGQLGEILRLVPSDYRIGFLRRDNTVTEILAQRRAADGDDAILIPVERQDVFAKLGLASPRPQTGGA